MNSSIEARSLEKCDSLIAGPERRSDPGQLLTACCGLGHRKQELQNYEKEPLPIEGTIKMALVFLRQQL
jgi:hypothetical protein